MHVGLKVKRHAFGCKQRLVLFDQRVLRLGEDRFEVLGGQRIELDANRKAPLQFGNQVRGLADVKRAGRDEQHVVGFDGAVLGVDRAALDDRQDVALHALARNVGAAARASRPATLSISSMKMMPSSPARRSASRLTASMSISFAASSCAKMRRASATVTRFCVLRFGQQTAEHLADVARR